MWTKIRANNESGKKKPVDSILNITDDEYNELLIKNNTSEEELEFMRDLESDLGDNWGDWDIAGKLKDAGYDAVVVNGNSKNKNEIVVFDAEQIQILKKEPIIINKVNKKYTSGIDKSKF